MDEEGPWEVQVHARCKEQQVLCRGGDVPNLPER